jgi:hypothetical protein
MSNSYRGRWLRPTLFLIAAATGLLILSLSLAGNARTELGVEAPPTLTAGEVSSLSDQIMATQEAVKQTVVAGLIDRGESVVGLPHSESTGRRIDAVLDLDSALVAADKLVTGRVVDQYLEWGLLEPWDYKAPVLVSVLVAPDGTVNRVAQPVDIGEAPDVIGLRLTYLEGNELLRYNETYSLLAIEDQDQPDRLQLIRGHAYFIDAGGGLSTAQGVTPRDALPLTKESLARRFAEAKTDGGRD